jgi:TRAP-type uncharacterized transport system substrate-binding protein
MLSSERILWRAAWCALAVVAVVVGMMAYLYGNGVHGKIVIATGGAGGAYHALAERYRKDLARYGVTLELRPKVEGVNTLMGLFPQYRSEFKQFDPAAVGINAGFIKGSFVETLHGRYATEKEQAWHQRQVEHLRSLGRMFHEPVWVVTRTGERLKSLRELKGKRVYVGSAVSGSRRVNMHLLQANGVDAGNTTLIQEEFPEDAGPLIFGKADAAMLIAPAESSRIQILMRFTQLRLMDFSAEADAYTTRFPSLAKVVLRQGAVEFDPEIPSSDITLISTSAALLVRADMNPSLASLLAYVVRQNPKPGTDKRGDPILFYKAGEFPSGNDPELQLHPSARAVYSSGELPVLLRHVAPLNAKLGIPFWVSAFVNEHGTQMLLLIVPLLSILVPLFHFAPIAYKWFMRRRLLYWYEQMTALENSLNSAGGSAHLAEKTAELNRIEQGVSDINLPLQFTDQLYDLRGHINIVRQRLTLLAAKGQ